MGKIHRNHITQNIIARKFLTFLIKFKDRKSRFILLLDQPRGKKKEKQKRKKHITVIFKLSDK